MQLLYYWNRQGKILNNHGVNFNPIYEFKECYREEEKQIDLKFTKRKDNHTLFNQGGSNRSGNINNITLFLGENGTGKTVFSKSMLNCLKDANNNYKSIAIFLYKNEEDREKIKIYSNMDEELNLKVEDEKWMELFEVNEDGKSKYIFDMYKQLVDGEQGKFQKIKEMEKCCAIYYSCVCDGSYLYRNTGGFKDISTNNLMRKDKSDSMGMNYEPLERDGARIFFYEEYKRQLEFICGYKSSENILPFKLPNYLRIENFDFKFRVDKMEEKVRGSIDENEKKFIDQLKQIYNKFNHYKKNGWISNYYMGLLCSIWEQIIYIQASNKEEYYEKVIKDIKKWIDNYESLICMDILSEDEKISFNILIDILNGDKKYFKSEACKEFIDLIIKLKSDIIHIKNRENKELAKEIFDAHLRASGIYPFLKFSWGMSTGEHNFLNLFARFYSIVKKKGARTFLQPKECNRAYENALIIIDEADMTMHPRWQQGFMEYLTKFLEEIYSECEIQLILTTHSPIIASDIPKSNIIYLKKEDGKTFIDNKNRKETFGANIYDIYNDAFFLDSDNDKGLIIGEYAKSRIKKTDEKLTDIDLEVNKIIEHLGDQTADSYKRFEEDIDRYKMDLEYCRYITGIVGEELIKNALDRKMSSIERKIKRIHRYSNNAEKIENIENSKVKEIQEAYKSLRVSEKKQFIEFILDNEK